MLLNIVEIKSFSLRRWRTRLSHFKNIYKPLTFTGLYALWVFGFKLLSLTFITYFTISPSARFQDISDAFRSNEVSLMGLSALVFVGLLFSLNPLASTRRSEILTRVQFEREFIPGFGRGAFLASGLILLFILSGYYKYLGYFIQMGEAPLELANVLLRMAALGVLVYCEEYIFRFKLPKELIPLFPKIVVANLIAILYCGIKLLQFDLGIMHLITLYLVSISLFYRIYRGPQPVHFSRSAGFWAAILIVFNPLLSLPIFGNDFQGILWVKYQSAETASKIIEDSSSLIRLFTGGAGGPISSFAFQLLLIIDIGRSILRQKMTA